MTTRCGVSPTPSGEISRGYGYGRGRTSRARRLHAGIDFRAARNTQIRAPWSGTVTKVATDNERNGALKGYGNAVVVHSSDLGIYWLFAHMAGLPWVTVGERIVAGRVLGQVGATSNGKFPGMGAHLHLETATLPWPKGYGRGNLDPAVVFARIGLDVVKPAGARARLVRGSSCAPVSFAGLRSLSEGAEVADGEEYEPLEEDETDETSGSSAVPLVLGVAALVGLFYVLRR
jgi:hypothetical protein